MATSPAGKMTSDFKGETLDSLDEWLSEHGVQTTAYGEGEAKPLVSLMTEIEEGETVLRLIDGKPLRLVNVLNVLIRNSKSQLLYEARQELPTGTIRTRNMPLAEKMLPGENWQEAVHRAVQEELGPVLPTGSNAPQVTVLEDTYENKVEYKNSQSYPGLSSQVHTSFLL